MPKILLKFNDSVLRTIEMNKDRLTVGRNARNDIRIDNLAVSNFHARIEKYPEHYCIEDLGSTNGTFINDRLISKCALNDSDAVTIGKHTLVFLLQEDETAAAGPGPLALDKTMILDTKAHRQRLARAADGEEPAPGEGRAGVLTIKEGKTGKREFVLIDRLTMIGRDDGAGVKLAGPQAPGIGGFVARDRNGYTLIPPEGRTSLKINGRPVKKGELLQDGDRIDIGGMTMHFHLRHEKTGR